jgi:predicted branched-subunit amino acid permease
MLEFRLALRLLRKQPVVTLTTLFALTIGIGMATTGFTLLDSMLYSKLPYPNGDRFVLFNAYTEPQAQRTAIDAERFSFFANHAS